MTTSAATQDRSIRICLLLMVGLDEEV